MPGMLSSLPLSIGGLARHSRQCNSQEKVINIIAWRGNLPLGRLRGNDFASLNRYQGDPASPSSPEQPCLFSPTGLDTSMKPLIPLQPWDQT